LTRLQRLFKVNSIIFTWQNTVHTDVPAVLQKSPLSGRGTITTAFLLPAFEKVRCHSLELYSKQAL